MPPLATRMRMLLCTIALALTALPGFGADKPNIVYIIADDLGWNDVGFHGGKVETPNLDKLAAGGATFNNFYSQPYSSQARAALMTGRYPMRYGLQTLSIPPVAKFGLPVEERTLGQALKEAGYRTAFLGKWGLGHAKPEFLPNRRGFDYFYGSPSGDHESQLRREGKSDWRRNEAPVKEEGFVTDLLAKDAVRTIGAHEGGAPLFMVVSFNAPAAAGAPKEFMDRQKDAKDDARRAYAAAVSAVDDAVGRIVAALEKRKLLENTLIVFQSDNGGAVPMKYATGDGDVKTPAADNGVLREGKGSLYDGGVRVVALASWPGKIKPQTAITGLVHVTDMYTTLLGLGGAKLEQQKKVDGMNIWPAMGEGQPSPRNEVLINAEESGGAVRVGEWKLIARATLPMRVLLFQLPNDPEETENKAESAPDKLKELMDKLNAYAFDMMPSRYLEEYAQGRPEMPMLPGPNAPRR